MALRGKYPGSDWIFFEPYPLTDKERAKVPLHVLKRKKPREAADRRVVQPKSKKEERQEE